MKTNIQGHLNQLYIRSAQGIYIQPNTNENAVVALANGETQLFYDNSAKIKPNLTVLRLSESYILKMVLVVREVISHWEIIMTLKSIMMVQTAIFIMLLVI